MGELVAADGRVPGPVELPRDGLWEGKQEPVATMAEPEATADHRQVPMWCPVLQKHIGVDENIAQLLRVLWNAGYITANSCEDNQGKIWIQFAEVSYRRFTGAIRIIANRAVATQNAEQIELTCDWFPRAAETHQYSEFMSLRVPKSDLPKLYRLATLVGARGSGEETCA